ncbi:MAG: 3'(2'),5'-bisphosphate nucleotidase CysQ [Candidatus Pacebacteria bacterium]|nr:3'(2'),5'-bisphosphate nucleotidase CysQ [Candidatus Paceibacterota bacterium]MCF7857391.1 3'(2'),5'-bisphosphate nucleotidase CysQ [Candidatus Paceibacterota bacterium]
MNSLLDIAIAAAKHAGDEIIKLYATTTHETKDDGSPVTVADMRSNEILTDHLSKTNITILSEESEGIATPYPEQMWIIDPLDGTKDFLEKTGDFSVMIGLLENGRPTLGVVYVPVHDILYYATKGSGAFLLSKEVTTRLSISDKPTSPLRFLRSVHNFSPYMKAVTEKLSAQLLPRGSIGVKAGILCSNAGDFFFSLGNFGEWDVCAPEIITLEAGGSVTDCEGNPLFYGTKNHRVEHGILFSNTACYKNVLDAIRTTPKE